MSSQEQCPTGVHSHVWKRLNAQDDAVASLVALTGKQARELARLTSRVTELEGGPNVSVMPAPALPAPALPAFEDRVALAFMKRLMKQGETDNAAGDRAESELEGSAPKVEAPVMPAPAPPAVEDLVALGEHGTEELDALPYLSTGLPGRDGEKGAPGIAGAVADHSDKFGSYGPGVDHVPEPAAPSQKKGKRQL